MARLQCSFVAHDILHGMISCQWLGTMALVNGLGHDGSIFDILGMVCTGPGRYDFVFGTGAFKSCFGGLYDSHARWHWLSYCDLLG